jgi:hypothetical protein
MFLGQPLLCFSQEAVHVHAFIDFGLKKFQNRLEVAARRIG